MSDCMASPDFVRATCAMIATTSSELLSILETSWMISENEEILTGIGLALAFVKKKKR